MDPNKSVIKRLWCSYIASDKRGSHTIFLSYFSMKTCYGNSLEAPQQGASNEYHMFSWRNKKTIITFWLKKVPYLKLI